MIRGVIFTCTLATGVLLILSTVWFAAQGRWHKYPEADEEWQTKMSLAEIQGTLGRFALLALESDLKAIQKIQNLQELWAHLQKIKDVSERLVSNPVRSDYLRDGWGRPYILEIKGARNEMVIRVISRHQGIDLYVELIIAGKESRTRRNWGRLSD